MDSASRPVRTPTRPAGRLSSKTHSRKAPDGDEFGKAVERAHRVITCLYTRFLDRRKRIEARRNDWPHLST